MIALVRSRFALSTGITFVLLVGCSASQSPLLTQAEPRSHQAVAPDELGGPCIYLLNTSEESDLSNMQVVAPNCYIYINDSANMSYSTITAAKIIYSGPPPNEIGATFPEATPAPGPIVSDPCATLSGCSYLANHRPSTSNCKSGNYSNAVLSPGCYDNLNLTGKIKLNPGLYVISGSQFHLQGSTVTGIGVTIYMTALVSDINVSAASLTLAAPTGGDYNSVLFYRDPSQGNAVNFSGCTCNLTGIVYFPTAQVNFPANKGNYQLLIFGQTNLSTSEVSRFGAPYRIEAESGGSVR